MEKQLEKQELVWIDGIFLTEPPIINATPVLGRLIVEHPQPEVLQRKKSTIILAPTAKDLYSPGDELYGRVLAVHPDEPNFKVGDYVVVPAPGATIKFSGVFCESVPVHSILAKINK